MNPFRHLSTSFPRVRLNFLGVLSLLFLIPGVPLRAIQTQQVEIGRQGVYDGRVTISRDASGKMLFQDAETPTPVPLSALTPGVNAHSLLAGLNADDHPLYLNSARHLSTHSNTFNALLPIPADPAGNYTLGEHVADSRLHLRRDQTVEITGNWRFSGTPRLWNNLELSAGGAPGDARLSFATATGTATFKWLEAAKVFALDRGVSVTGDLDTSGDARIARNLWAKGYLYGEGAHTPNYAEHLLLNLNDNANTPTVLDTTGHYNQIFLDPGGNPNTSQHTTPGVVGSALLFDGVDDHVDIGDRWYEVARAGQDFTLAFWWKFLDSNVANQYVLHQQPLPGILFYGYGTSNFKMGFYRTDGSQVSCLQAGVNDGNWRFYTVTRRGAILKWYVNGALIATDSDARNTGTLAYPYTTNSPSIGSSNGGLGNFAHGALDEFRLYKRALSRGEVAALYNAGAGNAARLELVTTLDGVSSLDRLALNGGFATAGALLQVSQGAYCDGNTWVNLSKRAAKAQIVSARPDTEWDALDRLRVVEFAYRKRNSREGQWLSPEGKPVSPSDPAQATLTGPETPARRTLLEQGYRLDDSPYLDEPETRRQLGFISEELHQADPRLARPDGIAAIEVAAFNTAVLQEAKRRILDLSDRLEASQAHGETQQAQLEAQKTQLATQQTQLETQKAELTAQKDRLESLTASYEVLLKRVEKLEQPTPSPTPAVLSVGSDRSVQ
ncbi:MAG TPA: hypothetical protein PLA90_07090 [Candidatus Sumerlaeota bacterium]|nr:hypothetical protein [Candidatus Sumerlaeota bacterium]